jgi:hypothetical protein
MANLNPEAREGRMAKMIEDVTEKLPSDTFLWTAIGSTVLSVALLAKGKKHAGLWVGQLGLSLLIMGLYNKVVKLEGHD